MAFAWWLRPVMGGVVTVVASVVLAAILAPGRTDIGPRGPDHDFREDVDWHL